MWASGSERLESYQSKGEQLEHIGRGENGNHSYRNYFVGPDREQGGLGNSKKLGPEYGGY